MLKMVPSGLRTTESPRTGIRRNTLMYVLSIPKKILKEWNTSTSRLVFLPIFAALIL